ncbi:MAG TPA: chloride channel protein [Myxococcales bacterium]|nr:chloride channel protein [Myxococcales bacterium]
MSLVDRTLRRLRVTGFRRLRWDNRVLALSTTIGIACAVVACAYYAAMIGLTDWIWEKGPLARWPMPLTCALGGTLVGVATWRLGAPGEISTVVNNLHMRNGKLDPKQNPSMTVISLLSIAFGGSAGPEAPLVQLCGSLGTWLGEKLKVRPRALRTATLSGMSSALGAFFGAPLGGSIFALEIPHRRGLEYYEALMPSILSGGVAYLIFRGVTGAGFGTLWHFAPYEFHAMRDLGAAIGIGLVGAAGATAFIAVFRVIFRSFEHAPLHPILRGAAGGLLLGLLSWKHPETLFFSEQQIKLLVAAHHPAATWLLLALIKAVAVGVTLGAGYRGGFIFPLFFIGACLGRAVAATVPGVDPSVAMLAAMAGINVGVTKTPISTTLILVALSGLDLLPVVLFASLVSFVVTLRIGMIETQGPRPRPSREEQPHSTAESRRVQRAVPLPVPDGG